jgi:hypothetical protein
MKLFIFFILLKIQIFSFLYKITGIVFLRNKISKPSYIKLFKYKTLNLLNITKNINSKYNMCKNIYIERNSIQ